jgi:hypothetical protein
MDLAAQEKTMLFHSTLENAIIKFKDLELIL